MKVFAFITLALLSLTNPAGAADFDSSKANVGVSYSFDGYMGFNAGYDISERVTHPITLQAFYKSKSETVARVSANHSGFGVMALYDLTKQFPLGDGVKPYAGVGLVKEDYSVAAGGLAASATSSGFQIAFGVTYTLNPNMLLDVNYSFGGANLGLNYKF